MDGFPATATSALPTHDEPGADMGPRRPGRGAGVGTGKAPARCDVALYPRGACVTGSACGASAMAGDYHGIQGVCGRAGPGISAYEYHLSNQPVSFFAREEGPARRVSQRTTDIREIPRD